MLSPAARAILAELIDSDDAMACVVPYGIPAAERALLLDHHAAMVRELREAGYPIETGVVRPGNGEVLWIAFKAGIVDDQRAADGLPL